jgi:hypothetical protein
MNVVYVITALSKLLHAPLAHIGPIAAADKARNSF